MLWQSTNWINRIGLCALLAAGGMTWAPEARAATWKAAGDIGLTHFDAQLDDAKDPMVLLLRVENHSRLESLKMSEIFVQMTDAEQHRLEPVTADDLVSIHLEAVRKRLPRHTRDIDLLLAGIQADFPQQKIVEVYGRLKAYQAQGLPITWRAQVENWLLTKPVATADDLAAADALIEEIGWVGRNYFWPRDLAPDSHYSGMLFFKRPPKMPVRIFFQIGDSFIGQEMRQALSTPKR